jgi:putative FmdB family regulatory protein
MPIYEYTCQECEAQFEKFVRSISSNVDVKCPKCGGTHVKKGWSVFGTSGSDGGLGSLSAVPSSSCSPGGT